MTNKAIFLDRDDTIIEDAGYISDPEQVKLIKGVPKALAQLREIGFKLVVVTNQSGVARGIFAEKALGEIHNRLRQLLSKEYVQLDNIYYCPYHPEGIVPKYRKESDLRKPSPGMLLVAAEEMDIDLDNSWMIGNSSRDIEAGLQAGCKTILLDNSTERITFKRGEAKPDFRAVNMKEAVNIIKQEMRSSVEQRQPEITETKPIVEAAEYPQHPETGTAKPKVSEKRTEHLLGGILDQLKSMHRQDMFEEFSILRMTAGLIQFVVFFCLVMGVIFLTRPQRDNDLIFITLGFAVVLQVMALTFYMINSRR